MFGQRDGGLKRRATEFANELGFAVRVGALVPAEVGELGVGFGAYLNLNGFRFIFVILNDFFFAFFI